jgi:hypothetical protein
MANTAQWEDLTMIVAMPTGGDTFSGLVIDVTQQKQVKREPPPGQPSISAEAVMITDTMESSNM